MYSYDKNILSLHGRNVSVCTSILKAKTNSTKWQHKLIIHLRLKQKQSKLIFMMVTEVFEVVLWIYLPWDKRLDLELYNTCDLNVKKMFPAIMKEINILVSLVSNIAFVFLTKEHCGPVKHHHQHHHWWIARYLAWLKTGMLFTWTEQYMYVDD